MAIQEQLLLLLLGLKPSTCLIGWGDRVPLSPAQVGKIDAKGCGRLRGEEVMEGKTDGSSQKKKQWSRDL